MGRTNLAEVLGGRKALQRRISGFNDMHEAVRDGLPFAALEALIQRLELSLREAAVVLRIPERTIARRKTEKKLLPEESDRLVRLARVFAHAAEVFETDADAAGWFKDSNRALGGGRPLDLLDTDAGVQRVDGLLTRIQHGVHS